MLAGNIANADTPGFQARDFDFAQALRDAAAPAGRPATAVAAGHLPLPCNGAPGDPKLAYRLPEQASLDGNTVELDRERANFADNSVRDQVTLRFINGSVRTILSAIKGE